MFQPKKFSAEINSTNINTTSTSLANSYERIHTLKEDFENFQAGGKEKSSETEASSEIPSQPLAAVPTQRPESFLKPTPAQPTPTQASVIKPPQKKSLLPEAKTEGDEQLVPDTLGTETFFQTRSPFDEKTKISKEKSETIPSKSKRGLIILFSIFLLFTIVGGGVYYWWSFIKLPQKEISSKITSAKQSFGGTHNDSQALEQWKFDLEADKITNKIALERYAKNLNASADEEKAIEIKILSRDNQLISPQKLEELLNFKLPASISDKLTEDYSLFLVKENNEPRMGAVFKLNKTLGLTESLKSEEATIFTNLKSFYLDKTPTDTETVFNSSKYKNADIRYFNFPSPPDTSFDYTVLSDKQNSYFIFSTSKNSIRAILDYMSKK